MEQRNRRSSDKANTLESALELYPLSSNPQLMPETTKVQRDHAGWILSHSLRRLMSEMILFHRLFLKLKKEGQWTEEYVLVKRKDIEKIDQLWAKFYSTVPKPDVETPPPEHKKDSNA